MRWEAPTEPAVLSTPGCPGLASLPTALRCTRDPIATAAMKPTTMPANSSVMPSLFIRPRQRSESDLRTPSRGPKPSNI